MKEDQKKKVNLTKFPQIQHMVNQFGYLKATQAKKKQERENVKKDKQTISQLTREITQMQENNLNRISQLPKQKLQEKSKLQNQRVPSSQNAIQSNKKKDVQYPQKENHQRLVGPMKKQENKRQQETHEQVQEAIQKDEKSIKNNSKNSSFKFIILIAVIFISVSYHSEILSTGLQISNFFAQKDQLFSHVTFKRSSKLFVSNQITKRQQIWKVFQQQINSAQLISKQKDKPVKQHDKQKEFIPKGQSLKGQNIQLSILPMNHEHSSLWL